MRIVLASLWLILAGQAWAAKYKDDFNRADTQWVAAGGMINAASKPYTYIISRGMFRIHEGLMVTDPEADQEKELIVEHLPVPLEDKSKFEASVDFLIPKPTDDLAVGIVFNYNLEEPPPGKRSFCGVRFRADGASQYLQFLNISSTESRGGETLARNLNVRNGKWYTLTVRIKAYPTLECTLKEAGSPGPELAFGLIDLTGTRGKDGRLGIHATGHGQVQFDNLSFSTD
jgi:hypothetical protein